MRWKRNCCRIWFDIFVTVYSSQPCTLFIYLTNQPTNPESQNQTCSSLVCRTSPLWTFSRRLSLNVKVPLVISLVEMNCSPEDVMTSTPTPVKAFLRSWLPLEVIPDFQGVNTFVFLFFFGLMWSWLSSISPLLSFRLRSRRESTTRILTVTAASVWTFSDHSGLQHLPFRKVTQSVLVGPAQPAPSPGSSFNFRAKSCVMKILLEWHGTFCCCFVFLFSVQFFSPFARCYATPIPTTR